MLDDVYEDFMETYARLTRLEQNLKNGGDTYYANLGLTETELLLIETRRIEMDINVLHDKQQAYLDEVRRQLLDK